MEVRLEDRLLKDPDNSDNDYFTISRQTTQPISLEGIAEGPVEIVCSDCSLGEGLVASIQPN